MKRSAIPIVAAVLSLAIVALLIYGITAKGGDTTISEAIRKGEAPQAPGATMALPNLDGGGTTTLASLRGKVVVLNFWASWCPPCEAEAPFLQKAQNRLAKSGDGTVLGATYNDTIADTRAFMREHKLSYPNVRDVGTKLAAKYGTIQLPETFVIDAKGRIVAVSKGQLDQAFLDNAVAKAKASGAS